MKNCPSGEADDCPICHDSHARVFVLRMTHSYYAMRVAKNGSLVHVDSGLLPEGGVKELNLRKLDLYDESGYPWEYQATPYELPAFGDVTYHDCGIKVSFPRPAPGADLSDAEPGNLPIRNFRPVYESHTISTDMEPGLAPWHGLSPACGKLRHTLAIRMRDIAYSFWMTLHYRVTPELDIIERWVEVENRTDAQVEIEALAFATLHLPNGTYEVCRPEGNWCREFSMTRHLLPSHKVVVDQRGLNTGHHANPFFLINELGEAAEHCGLVWSGALAYSGNWQLVFERLGTGQVRIHGGYEQSDFRIVLLPGQSHKTPAFIVCISDEGRAGVSLKMHEYFRKHILPDLEDRKFRPVIYNSWEATYFDVSLENQVQLAKLAASIGIELFCLDDGWFGSRTCDNSGLGDWVPRLDAFPQGLRPLSDTVHALGMRFGVWVEPEMVNPDSELYRKHPDWVMHFPGRPRTLFRNQLILDFGRREVIDYIGEALDRLISENKIDFLKWDMNRYAVEAGSVSGQAIWYKHVEALYGLMDGLRRSHPSLEIQTCSGGGGRVDAGVLGRADQAWTSDNTDAMDRISIQEGFSYIYPARAMECWVTHEVNHQTGRNIPLDFRFDVATRGALGIGTSLDRLSAEDLNIYKRKIAFYKKLRPVIQEGDLHRLRLLARDGWSAWLYVAKDAAAAVYSVAIPGQEPGRNFAPPKLRGLRAGASYRVTDESGVTEGVFSGAQLLCIGMPGDNCFGGYQCSQRSRTLLLEICS